MTIAQNDFNDMLFQLLKMYHLKETHFRYPCSAVKRTAAVLGRCPDG